MIYHDIERWIQMMVYSVVAISIIKMIYYLTRRGRDDRDS